MGPLNGGGGDSGSGAVSPTASLKDFYLNTPLAWYEYMGTPVAGIPPDIMQQYNLADLV